MNIQVICVFAVLSIVYAWTDTYKNDVPVNLYYNSPSSGFCMGTFSSASKSRVYMLKCNPSDPNQQWMFNVNSHTWKQVSSGLCMQPEFTPYDQKQNSLATFPCDGSTQQQWWLYQGGFIESVYGSKPWIGVYGKDMPTLLTLTSEGNRVVFDQELPSSPPSPPPPPPNPCTNNNGGCSPQASCVNNNGQASCTCNSGYEGDGKSCSLKNPCNTNNGGCDKNAACTNNNGQSSCSCNSGYNGNGFTCTVSAPSNPCTNNNGGCSPQASCVNNNGQASCTCNSGYEGDGKSCSLKNPCNTNNGGCDKNAACTNNNGQAKCSCNSGYDGNGFTCTVSTPSNPCFNNNGGCSQNAACSNVNGQATCSCNSGYSGDGKTCTVNIVPSGSSSIESASQPSSQGLSTGAIAGITVGCLAAAGLAVGGIMYFKRKPKETITTSSTNDAKEDLNHIATSEKYVTNDSQIVGNNGEIYTASFWNQQADPNTIVPRRTQTGTFYSQ